VKWKCSIIDIRVLVQLKEEQKKTRKRNYIKMEDENEDGSESKCNNIKMNNVIKEFNFIFSHSSSSSFLFPFGFELMNTTTK
jgi:hypothetical protein